MKFKGSRGLMINGVEFEDEVFETNDKGLIDRFLQHPGMGIFFSVYQEEEIVEEETEEEIRKKHHRTIEAEKMRVRENRALELNKLTLKELSTLAQGLGYAGEQLSKDGLIIWIIKTEEELEIPLEEGKDDSQ